MSEIIITSAGLADRAFIRSVSERTWPSTYGHIISQAQIDFMLDWMYSDESLEKQMNTGSEFYIASIKKDNELWDAVGFCSVSPEKEEDSNEIAHKLNKLYVLPEAQGTGAGKALLNKSIEVAEQGKKFSNRKDLALWLLNNHKDIMPFVFGITDNKQVDDAIWKFIKPEFEKI